MTNEMKSVPELRFLQFDKEWEKTTIADIGDFYYGRSAPKWSITDDATIPCVRYGELYTKHKGTVKEIYSYTNIDRNKLRFSKGGEILIPRVGEDPMDFAKCSYLPFSGIAIGEMISVYNTDQNPVFITAYFNSQMKYEFAKRVEGASVSNLYYSYLKDINLRIPTIEEQQKIGIFFSKLDRQIELEEQKLEKLEEEKKGYMQKIFSQELRFKGNNGEEYPKWESKKLEEVAIINTGKSKIVNEESAAYSNLGSTGVLGKSSHYEYDGNFILTARVGHYAGKLYNFSGKANISDNTIFLETDLNLNFTLNMLNNYNLKRIAFGSGQPLIKSSELKKLIFNIPCGEEEQKIGGFLSGFDSLIGKQSHKIELLKERKKGFLQKMFV
ncbi:restriction endonuclease subunit S [Staphylococcus sp. ACRSN]|uniref:restriction endonuclease subunit S n=1 Tax=Staphylococcus sp. ACRSN TaxID=2918214 RepID=UPI001EF37748|nr:restriction endonuclease subunit S [Staphylococcus sp. ACRSN]MCG7340310.1 restriction endonuclease subunit S [Staphylococcus sp. ACRSN]